MNRKTEMKSRPAAIALALGTLLALSASAWAAPEPEPQPESPTEANGAAPEMQLPTDTDMGAMDHTKMQMPTETDMGAMDHTKMQMPTETDMDAMDHTKMQMPTETDMNTMDHTKMQMPTETDMGAMDHAKMQMPTETDMGAMDHAKMQMPTETDMGAMDHARMQMQGGKAPEDARDPHQYSGGYQLDGGPYALAPEDRLRLADEHQFGSFMVNRLEYLDKEAAVSYDIQAWYGTSYDKFTLLAEGDYGAGRLQQSQTELLWSHALATFWDSQLGVRLDQNLAGSSRQWLAMGVQGLAPYWFELALTGYLGDGGATALVLEAEYELLLTQNLILQPMAELTFYGKQDEINDLGSGLSSAAMGVRLRYEISRQFAPYLGVEWTGTFGSTADYAALQGQERQETSLLAGIRFWF
jgi:copper resistance protein B